MDEIKKALRARGREKRAALRAELAAEAAVLNALQPLQRDEQARVLLWAVLKYCPGASREWIDSLIVAARGDQLERRGRK